MWARPDFCPSPPLEDLLTIETCVSTWDTTNVSKETCINQKRPIWIQNRPTKETYWESRHVCRTGDAKNLSKETCGNKKRPTKETYWILKTHLTSLRESGGLLYRHFLKIFFGLCYWSSFFRSVSQVSFTGLFYRSLLVYAGLFTYVWRTWGACCAGIYWGACVCVCVCICALECLCMCVCIVCVCASKSDMLDVHMHAHMHALM